MTERPAPREPAEVLNQPGVVGALADRRLASGRIAGVAAGVARPTLLLAGVPGMLIPP